MNCLYPSILSVIPIGCVATVGKKMTHSIKTNTSHQVDTYSKEKEKNDTNDVYFPKKEKKGQSTLS